jgi:hypothetical protein
MPVLRRDDRLVRFWLLQEDQRQSDDLLWARSRRELLLPTSQYRSEEMLLPERRELQVVLPVLAVGG